MSGARGTLRIYLGAAPGVGKTYAMLGEGHRRAERGTDVVVGFVETHGRKHTAEAIGDLEVIPRRIINYRGVDFTEMDVDAILARHPKVALVDELPHTNVPGSRNEKRWQDVEELLAAGITVLSTVNIQQVNLERAKFKGGIMKLAILLKGFEVPGPWKQWINSNCQAMFNFPGTQSTGPVQMQAPMGMPGPGMAPPPPGMSGYPR